VDHKVCIMVLYLLIWGEAANICFLPERLCYFFYHMTYEMYDLLEKPQVERSEKTYIEGSQYLFLEEILAAVSCNTLSLFWLLTNWIGNAGQLCTFVVKCFAISSSL
jgi:hypothetical protein